jgi:murein L,D-transpeptidase YcbB/YkuD
MAQNLLLISILSCVSFLLSAPVSAAMPALSWSTESLSNYKNAIADIHVQSEVKWHENNVLKPDVEAALTFISSDEAFVSFLTDENAFVVENNLTTVETLLEYERNISQLFAWYFILEFSDEELEQNTEWRELLVSINSSDITALSNKLLSADEKIDSLRQFLYQYLAVLADPSTLFNLSIRGLELDVLEHQLPNIKPYKRWQSVILARILLKVHGFPTQQVSNNIEYYDQSMLDSTLRFQHSKGLAMDGIIGPKTWHKLLQKPYYTLASIRFTIRKLRQRPIDSSSYNLAIVNIPAYQLLIANQHAMRVIVGSKKNPTPILDDEIASVVVNPEWNIPRRIVRESIKPNMREDANYLADNNIKVYLGWGRHREEVAANISVDEIDRRHYLVQSAGDSNALGRIKFVTTNKQAVLLHDTNARYLFDRAGRALSNGCIRLEHPWLLMQHLVENKSVRRYNSTLKRRWLKDADTKIIKMSGRFEVKSVYWLAWVDQHQQLHVYQDIYRQNS